MIEQADKDWVKTNSAEIIAGTGETITRRRLDTSETPDSYDEDYGEATNKTEESYDELEFTGKVFFSPSEKMMVTKFGGRIDAAAIVHVAIDTDVVAGDLLVIREIEYRVTETKEAALKGFCAVAVDKKR